MVTAVFDKIAYQYDDNRGGEPRGTHFAASIISLLTKGEKVLELGVGTGVVAGAVQKANFDVTGIDISREMLKCATSRVKNLIWADMNRLPFLDSYFGSVYSVWAIHLADDIASMMSEVRRVLREGGRFLNCAAAHGPPDDVIGKIVWRMQSALSGPTLTADSPERLTALAAGAGFAFETIADVAQQYTTTANTIATHLERRGMSTLQRATPEQTRTLILPAIEELRSLPDPDADVVRRSIHKIVVLRAV